MRRSAWGHTHCVCSLSFASGILSLIRSALIRVHCESCTSTLSLRKTSNSANFWGSSSMPKGFRLGAFAMYWRRVYSSNISGLLKIRMRYVKARGITHVRPRCEDTNFRSASPMSDSMCEGSGLRHSVSRS